MSMTDERVKFSENDSLISTTTADSHITYCNEDFCQIAGYQQEELLDKPHNVIRHDDMPKAAFGQLWQYIQSGNSWMGIVKNKCKNSGHYWVSAFVTPIMGKDGKIFEYQSVRTQPSDEQISRAAALYQRLTKGDVTIRRIPWLKIILSLSVAQIVFIALLASGFLSNYLVTGALFVTGIAQFISILKLNSRVSSVNQLAESHYDNPLMEQPYTGHCDDVSKVELAMMMKKAELRAVTARANETSDGLLVAAKEEFSNSQAIDSELNQQDVAIDAMAASAEQMLGSISEVAEQAKQSSEFALNAQKQADVAVNTIDDAVLNVQSLSEQLEHSKTAINQLYADVDGIESILSMIQGIAEQTNLLALNAAIEAARAGEHGRGFAVVADEVRALSAKTTSSIEEIRSNIETLQLTVNKAGSTMEKGIEASVYSVDKSQQSKEAFQTIVDALVSIGTQSGNTSTAIVEQVQVTQTMTEHVSRMKEANDTNRNLSNSSLGRTKELVGSLESLQRLVTQFSHS
ncbi:PAS domain-containing methyl-accepting chemotaxis protein [Vibrio sp. 99-8-1]|uniref:methyl-accepting chemotaxis protein n=1 Tax=Vibrio sp. 99-8-1 TaxID=2607602 RepID=UPI00149390A1|nr:PAS domain-containing methyl-accepting chemotaxis protein [Vibrio sp. 99-8-1]NOI68628.1 methyl-accepting chemotaxis protein [Vibrio sp. 99-8-1]